MVVEPINTFTFQHQQTMLHDVNFHHGQGSARLKSQAVYREVERGVVGDQSAYGERFVTQQRLRLNAAFIAGERGGSSGLETIEGFFDDRYSGELFGGDRLLRAGGKYAYWPAVRPLPSAVTAPSRTYKKAW